MKLKVKRVAYILLVAVFTFSSIKTVKANIIEDILRFFGFEIGAKTTSTEEVYDYNKIEEGFDEDQKAVAKTIEEIYVSIKEVDIKSLEENVDANLPLDDVKKAEDLINSSSELKENIKYIFKNISYNTVNIEISGSEAKAKVAFTMPSIREFARKIVSKVFLKYANVIISGIITDDNIRDIMATIKKELEADPVKLETYTYDFSFIKRGSDWKLTDVNNIVKNATDFIKSNTN